MNTSNSYMVSEVAIRPEQVPHAYEAYKATGGELGYDAWAALAPLTPRKPSNPSNPSRKAKAKAKAKGSNPSRATRDDIKAVKRTIASKTQAKANGKHNPSLADSIDLAAQHAAAEQDERETTRKAIRAFESSSSKRDAAVQCAKYFGVGTVRNMTRPLWVSKWESQRDAVGYMWTIPTDADNKPLLDAKVQLMVRLRADGYKLLKVAPPVPKKGRDKAPIVDRAVAASRKFLLEMVAPAQRREFLAKVAEVVKALNAPAKTAAA